MIEIPVRLNLKRDKFPKVSGEGMSALHLYLALLDKRCTFSPDAVQKMAQLNFNPDQCRSEFLCISSEECQASGCTNLGQVVESCAHFVHLGTYLYVEAPFVLTKHLLSTDYIVEKPMVFICGHINEGFNFEVVMVKWESSNECRILTGRNIINYTSRLDTVGLRNALIVFSQRC